MMKAGSDCGKLPLKTTKDGDGSPASRAAAKEISVYVAVAAVLSRVDGVLHYRKTKDDI